MKKVWVIIKREYLTRVRTKAFVIGTILTPLLMLGLITVPALLAMRGGGERFVTVFDQSGDPLLFDAIKKRAEARGEFTPDGDPPMRFRRFTLTRIGVPPDENIDEVRSRFNPEVEKDSEKAYVVLRQGVLEGVEPEYYAKNVTDFSIDNLERVISSAVTERRLVKAGLDPDKVNGLIKPVAMKTRKVGPEGETEGGGFGAFIVPYAMLVFIYMTVFIYGISVMRGVIEEKQSRIVEVVVSSVRPTQMMLGKLVGIGLVGLTQVVIWALSFFFISTFGAVMFGASASSIAKIPVSLLVYFVVFYLLGYFLFSALYAMIGAMVSSEEEAQQAQTPVTILVVAPMIIFTMIMNNPNSAAAIALSMVPFFAPTLMMLRIALVNPPLWQVLLSMLIMVAAILGAVWVAARIYRVGILMYGKRPSIAELGRWLRYS